jgi:hypothetical protein
VALNLEPCSLGCMHTREAGAQLVPGGDAVVDQQLRHMVVQVDLTKVAGQGGIPVAANSTT